MAVCFITGKTGSGKTNYLYDQIIAMSSIKETSEKQLLIVPEQSTLNVQHEVIKQHPNHCISDIEVLSFGRLAHRMSDDLGVAGKTVLSDVGKSMLIRKIIKDDEENYPFLGSNIHKKGYITELRGLLGEFSRYAICDGDFDELIGKVDDTLLKHKLFDCRKLHTAYRNAVEDTYFSGDTLLERMVDVIETSPFLKEAHVYIDGFYGFTPIQYHLLEKLAATVKHLTVLITIDNGLLGTQQLEENHLYYESHETYKRLRAITDRLPHLEIDTVRLDKKHVNPAFNHLRDSLYQYPYKIYNGNVQGFYLAKVSSVSREVAYVRDSIMNLVREKGYRYRDIAVLGGDVSRYGRLMEASFDEAQLPYYIDSKKSMLQSDVAGFVLSVVNMARQRMSYSSVFTYLKSGYVEVEEETLDYLENYVLRYGIRGLKSWFKPMAYTMPGIHQEKDAPLMYTVLEKVNSMKDMLLEPIAAYLGAKPETVREHIVALYRFLESIGLQKKLEQRRDIYMENGHFNRSREYNQMFRLIMDLLDQLHEIGPSDKMDYDDFYELLQSGLEQLELGNVPARVDEILVGDLTRSRLSERKVVFIIGVNEGLVPKLSDGVSLLSDRERDLMESKGFIMAPSARKNLFRDQFYIYLKLLEASERVYLSHAQTDDEGKVARPAHLLYMIRKLCPKIREYNVDTLYLGHDVINHPEVVYGRMVEQMQSGNDESIGALMRWYQQDERYEGRLAKAVSGRRHQVTGDMLSDRTTRKMYGDRLLNSVSRLEQFRRCPFAHFSRYGLNAQERETYEITMPQLGLIFHRVIELFSKRVIERGLNWSQISDAIRRAWIDELCDSALAEENHIVFFDSHRNKHRIQRLKHILNKTLYAIGHQISQGSFEPVSSEMKFKGDDEAIKTLNLPLDGDRRMCLQGTIDRVDMVAGQGMKYLTVIDYKSSSQGFDLGDIYHGLQLQLMVYLNAAVEVTQKEQQQEITPAGVFYFKIDDPFVEDDGNGTDEQIDEAFLRKFRLNGVVIEDEQIISLLDSHFVKDSTVIPVKRNRDGSLSKSSKTLSHDQMSAVRAYVSKETVDIGNEIVKGTITPLPFKKKEQTACEYCIYRSVCGFDDKLTDCQFAKLPPMPEEGYMEMIMNALSSEDDD